MESFKVVIIEDEEAHFSLMQRAIARELPHVAVHHFTDAHSCLQSLKEILPSAIITDYRMPGMNGIELLETLNQQYIDIPVVVITGQGDENVAVQSMKLGAKDYLVKSENFFALLPSVIKKVVRERKVSEALLESEEKYAMVVNNATLGIVITQDGLLKMVNPQATEISGYSQTELTARPFVEFVYPDDRDMVFQYHMRRLKGEDVPATYLFRIIPKEGGIKWIENKGVLITWEDRPATLNFLSDVTERKLMEEALQRHEAQKKAVLDASIDRIRYVDANMKIVWANQTFYRDVGMPYEALVGRCCYELARGIDKPCEGCPTVKSRETRRLERAVMFYPGKRNGDKERYWDCYSVPIIDEQGEVTGFIQISRDVTEQKKAEHLIRDLSQLLMQAQERERQMISYELHDRVAQNLSTLKIGFDTIFDGESIQPSASVIAKMDNISRLTEKTIMTVRDLAYELRPPGLDEMGLIKALEIYCEEFSAKTGLHVDLQVAGIHESELALESKINLYRLVQEGLNNIHKHAAAGQALIRLVGSSPNIILRIEDDGKGFDVHGRERALSREKRMGLRSMRERVNLLQGQMHIESRLNKGTKIFIRFPVEERNSEREETDPNH